LKQVNNTETPNPHSGRAGDMCYYVYSGDTIVFASPMLAKALNYVRFFIVATDSYRDEVTISKVEMSPEQACKVTMQYSQNSQTPQLWAN
jgi:hypothetical protein